MPHRHRRRADSHGQQLFLLFIKFKDRQTKQHQCDSNTPLKLGTGTEASQDMYQISGFYSSAINFQRSSVFSERRYRDTLVFCISHLTVLFILSVQQPIFFFFIPLGTHSFLISNVSNPRTSFRKNALATLILNEIGSPWL